jgi:hypothetical protein
MTTTLDAAGVIEKLNAAGQHELAAEIAVEALKASGTSPPSGGTTFALGTSTDPRDQTAAERGFSWAELSRLSQAEIAKVREEAPELDAESFRQLPATRASDSSNTPVHWSDGTAA